MKLGTLKSTTSLDGELCVISRDLKRAVRVPHIAGYLRQAIEHWDLVEAKLKKVYEDLNENKLKNIFEVEPSQFHSALPRTWLFADGSAFLYHVKLVRQARGAEVPASLYTTPLMYQGESGQFLAPTDKIPQIDFSQGTDFEGEVGVITDFVPMGISAEKALEHIKLVVLINDVSLRGLIPEELAQGFGFFQSKPASALSPFAVTPDELGASWKEGRLHRPLDVKYNHQFFGNADAGVQHFHFGQLIAHAARTRNLSAGSLIGSGTVSNEDHSRGSSCLAEKRMIEKVEQGEIKTSFMKDGDHIQIEMFDDQGQSIFGQISQTVHANQ